MTFFLLIWLTGLIGAGLIVLLGMASEYNKHKTKGH